MKNQPTKRTQNKCGSCGYTWYPRGSNLSAKCPKCGSNKTKKVGIGIVATLFLAYAFLGGNNQPSKDTHIPVESLSAESNSKANSHQKESVITTEAYTPEHAITVNKAIIPENHPEPQPSVQTNNQADYQSENELGFAEKLMNEGNYPAAKHLVKQVLVKHPENQRAMKLMDKMLEITK